jgi:hypothetical protein
MVRLVTDKPDPSTEPHISSHELQRLLAMIVTRNPLQKGMVSVVYEAFTAASE